MLCCIEIGLTSKKLYKISTTFGKIFKLNKLIQMICMTIEKLMIAMTISRGYYLVWKYKYSITLKIIHLFHKYLCILFLFRSEWYWFSKVFLSKKSVCNIRNMKIHTILNKRYFHENLFGFYNQYSKYRLLYISYVLLNNALACHWISHSN